MAMRKSACHLTTMPNETVVLQDEISGITVQKGVAFRDTLLALKIIQWTESGRFTGSTGGRENRTEYCTEAAWPVICEDMPGCRETRHPGIFAMCFCLVVPIIRFPGPAFPLCVYRVRLHDVENRKPAMACSTFTTFAGWRCRASGDRLAADRAGEKYVNVINRYHNVTS